MNGWKNGFRLAVNSWVVLVAYLPEFPHMEPGNASFFYTFFSSVVLSGGIGMDQPWVYPNVSGTHFNIRLVEL